MSEGIEDRLRHCAFHYPNDMTNVYATDVVEVFDEKAARIRELEQQVAAITSQRDALRAAAEAALRIETLWMHHRGIIDDQGDEEGYALWMMKRGFVDALALGNGEAK